MLYNKNVKLTQFEFVLNRVDEMPNTLLLFLKNISNNIVFSNNFQ